MAKISPDIISFCGQIGLMMLSSHLVPNIRHIERNGMNTLRSGACCILGCFA